MEYKQTEKGKSRIRAKVWKQVRPEIVERETKQRKTHKKRMLRRANQEGKGG
jgi:hypothetical protein